MHCPTCNYYSWSGLLILMLAQPAFAENDGLGDLDKATQLKVTAENLQDLNEVVDRLDTAIDKGLDKENGEFAQELLMATLLQRGSLFAGALLNMNEQRAQPGLPVLRFRTLALSDLQRVVEYDPKQWEAQMLIGRLQLLRVGGSQFGDTHAAKQALTAVADADDAPSELRAEAFALRSELQRSPEKQLKDLNRAVELEPELPDFLRLRAQHYLVQKEFDKALADVDGALKLEPDHPPTNELRGTVLLSLERYDEALECFNKASELTPGDARPFQFRAQLYRQKGDLEKAVEQLTKALELSPDNVATLLVRAGVYYELEKPDLALADVDEAIRIQPALPQPYQMRAEILAATGRLDQAIAELRQLISQVRGEGAAGLVSRLGSFYMIANQPHKAIESLSKAIDLNPNDENAYRLRADAYLSTGHHADAINDFEHVYSQSEKDAGLLNNLAWVLATSPDEKLRNGERAVKLATEACELTGYETPHILSTLAAAFAETGDFENAKKWSSKSIEMAQKELNLATADEERERLKNDEEQLKKELATYEEGKPVRERQSVEDAELPSTITDNTNTPTVPPAPARTADF